MSDDRVIQYLRTRAQVEPGRDLVARLMAAVEEAPPVRSPFAAFLPAVAIAGAVAIVIALALILGQGPNVGPTPTDSLESVPSPATSAELQAAVESGLAVLREAPAVEGVSTSSVLGELGDATWFSWRPDGDQIVISRTDVDVSATAWWLDPGGGPPTRGENVTQTIQVLVGDAYFVADGDSWVVQTRSDAPPILALSTGILDEAPGVGGFLRIPDGERTVTRNPDGATTWRVTSPYRDGSAISEWRIAPDGSLMSWSHELVSVIPTADDTSFATFGQIEYRPVSAAGPIEAPDPGAPPDPYALGLPPDFPLEPAAP